MYAPLNFSFGWPSIFIDWPSRNVCVVPDSTIERISLNSREPEESSSSAPKIAFIIACGADCPVIDLRALSNSFLESLPFPSESNLEKSASAVYPLSRRIP